MSEQPTLSRDEIVARSKEAVETALARNIPGLPRPEELVGELGFSPTPREVVYSRDILKLYHYPAVCDEIYRVPLLLVMSLVSKPYIFDLAKGQSLIEFLIGRGHDVYMIDWGIPRREHTKLCFADYILDLIPDCVEQVARDSGERDLTMVGYCLGGTIAAMYAAAHADGPLKNLVCLTTPVNSEGMELQRTWADPSHFDIDRLVDELGNIPPELVISSMEMLRPLQRVSSRMKLLDNVENDEFVKAHLRIERWANDQIPFPGEVARQMQKDFLVGNKLFKGEFRAGEKRIDLSEICVPFMHVRALHDHLVPDESSRDLIDMVSSEDKTDIVLKGGHVSLIAGGNAKYRLWPQIDSWLAERGV
jgi:polyhydroxyalkanoate synthase